MCYNNVMRTLTVKLYGSDDFGYLSDMINIAGIIYNTALTIIEDHYTETGKLLDKYELQKQLRDLRNADENRHWRYVGSQAVQEITDRIYRAYRLFFTNREKGVKCSPPRRRKVKKYKSVTYKQAGYRFLTGGRISINGHIYRYWDSYDGLLERIKIKTVTIKRNILGEFFVYVTTDSPATMRENRLLIIFGVFNFNIYLGVIAALSVIIGASYMLWMFQRAILQDRPEGSAELNMRDLKIKEIVGLVPWVVLVFIMGFYPEVFIDKFEPTVTHYLQDILQIGATR